MYDVSLKANNSDFEMKNIREQIFFIPQNVTLKC